MNRRKFLRNAAGATMFTVLPRRLVAGSGQTPPSETVNVAAIGAGGRASVDIDGLEAAGARIVALCDVDQRRCGGQRKKHPNAPFFTFYKEIEKVKDTDVGIVLSPCSHFQPGFHWLDRFCFRR